MNRNYEVLALIPARGGSKGIPKKSIVPLAGKPLIGYSIDAAKNSQMVTRIVVSTDDEEYSDVTVKLGAEVPFLRPEDLAKDDTPTLPVVEHAVNYLAKQGYNPDIIVLLQPTSPLRTAEHIDEAIQLLVKEQADSVLGLCKTKAHPYWLKKINNNRVENYTIEGQKILRRQDLPDVYMPNGAIYAFWTKTLDSQSLLGNTIVPYIMDDIHSLDIDTPLDLLVAEALLERGGILD